MPSTSELRDQAVAHLKQTTITYPEWKRRTREIPDYEGGHWKKALDLLAQIEAPPPTPSIQQSAQNVVFVSDNAWQALESPKHYKLAVSADPVYRQWESEAWLAAAIGRTIYTWCDCVATPAPTAIALAQEHGFAGWIGEAETPEQLLRSLQYGAKIIIGNPNSWTDRDRATITNLIALQQLAVIAECYTNDGDPWPSTYNAQGVPVASLAIGLYAGSRGYIPVSEYKAHTPQPLWGGISAYVSGLHPGELAQLP